MLWSDSIYNSPSDSPHALFPSISDILHSLQYLRTLRACLIPWICKKKRGVSSILEVQSRTISAFMFSRLMSNDNDFFSELDLSFKLDGWWRMTNNAVKGWRRPIPGIGKLHQHLGSHGLWRIWVIRKLKTKWFQIEGAVILQARSHKL